MKKRKLKSSEDFREDISCVEKEASKIYDKAIDVTAFSFEEGEFLLNKLAELNSSIENIKTAINQHNMDMKQKLKLYFWLKNILWILAMSMCYVSVPIALIIEIFVIISINKYHNYRKAIIDESAIKSLVQEMIYISNNLSTSSNFINKKRRVSTTETTLDVNTRSLSGVQKLNFESLPLVRQRILY